MGECEGCAGDPLRIEPESEDEPQRGPTLLPTYGSPRWSAELMDCSMPMTMDTYSTCAYSCAYCFSAFQRSIGPGSVDYNERVVKSVDVEAVKDLFLNPPDNAKGRYIQGRRVFQWGGLSDQFDPFERHYGVTLELLRFFREIDYPISFSTKGAWWTEDDRYREVFKDAPWHVKFSMITMDERKAAIIERGCPSVAERLAAIERTRELIDHVTLRFRPFIIGVSNPGHRALIARAAAAGCDSVTTEFFCLEMRASSRIKAGFKLISGCCGFDILAWYQKHSPGQSGYLRLNREVKRPYVDAMEDAARRAGIRFYVSDVDFKERSDGGSCCGLPESWSYIRGQITEAILIAKREGRVRWSDIAGDTTYQGNEPARGRINLGDLVHAAPWIDMTMNQWMRYHWNHPDSAKSPYRYFDGVMRPVGVDDDGDVIYEYDETRT